MAIIYLNGEYIPEEDAQVSIFDRGFLFADGIYEVIPVFNRRLFRFDEHYSRLLRSLEAISLPPPISNSALREICETLFEKIAANDQRIYIQITRGTCGVRSHDIPNKYQPTVLVMSHEIKPAPIQKLQQGIHAITHDDIRWDRCDIKSIALLPNVLMYEQAREANAQEALLINDNHAIEGSMSNLFIVKNNTLITPPKSHKLLGGITRDLILELAQQHGISHEERDITKNELFDADEIWISSSTYEIRPILQLDGQQVGHGKAGPIWQRMIEHYQTYKAKFA